ncbi:response regulator transcription factor [Alkalicoccus urumqiensis]|uniref:DNA-binding response regulator n=1 Tax=Alkalicoccus urumqiensis TaxID=1548213 RepID=A0A2P6MJX9_ALKUR|nr:response regulator transcription factor [Alkalicoccus urumqiensis]PRO66555.1 DNA-binding response regulator [Alkalicoccus urumqiensis]
MIRILLAEDQTLVRQGLKMMMETDPDFRVVYEAENGAEAVRYVEGGNWVDLAVLDIRMPEMDGLEAAEKLLALDPELPVVMLTTFNDEAYALRALTSGARGYMLKNADAGELIAGLRKCLDGGLLLESQVAAKVLPKLMGDVKQKAAAPLPELSERERALLRCVGAGMNNKEIAAELYLSVGTVKNQLSQLLDKLELRDRTQLAIFAVRHEEET